MVLVTLFSVLTVQLQAQTKPDSIGSTDSVAYKKQLGGVTVEGRTAIQKDDHTNYMPTRRQAEASISAIGLLARMMIPKLVVNMADRSVKNADNAELSIYIDNRKADAAEADRLRPKDIVRVEHYDRPTAMFPGEQTVLNFITRTYDRGGYVDARTNTFVFPAADRGAYSLQAGLDTRKLNFTLLAGADYSREDSPGTSGTESFRMAEPFSKRTTALDRLVKNRNYYGIMRTTFRTEKTTVYADLGLNWSETPTNRLHTAVDYTHGSYAASEAATTSASRTAVPSARLFLETVPRQGHRMRLSANYSHSDNTYSRTYAEGTLTPVLTDTRERSDHLDAGLTYIIDLKRNNSLSLHLWGTYRNSRASYTGTVAASQRIDDGGVLFLPSYSHTLGRKLMLSAQASIYWDMYKVEGAGTVNKVLVSPTINANYKISNRSTAYLRWTQSYTVPQMSVYNNIEQRVNQYMVTRGNPQLEIMKIRMLGAGYNLTLKNANLSVFGSCTIYGDLTKPLYFEENGTLVRTFASDGKFFDYSAGGAASVFLFGRSLQLNTQLTYCGQNVRGLNADNNGQLKFSAFASYFLKSFNFYAQYVTKQKLLQTSCSYYEIPHYYLFGAAWNHKGLRIEVMCQHPFEKNYSHRAWADYGIYSFCNTTTNNLSGRLVSLGVSYSFDFGRKKVERTRLEVEKGTSGIMKL